MEMLSAKLILWEILQAKTYLLNNKRKRKKKKKDEKGDLQINTDQKELLP